jgi:hypothetical protein
MLHKKRLLRRFFISNFVEAAIQSTLKAYFYVRIGR